MNISLTNPTGRKTQAHIATIGQNEYFFSYQTCIAFRGYDEDGQYCAIRRPNDWGPTTGRHFRELGCANFHMLIDGYHFERRLAGIHNVSQVA